MNPSYQPRYSQSWAIVIGINRYASVRHLQNARSDASAVASLLIKRFAFPESNVFLLCDEDATRVMILDKLLSLVDAATEDDRVVFFFAGHGDTRQGRRGDVGYLLPQDADPTLLSTWIRWDELTRNSDLIRAKHVLFLMDACYGGLALTRAAPPGSMRFAKDMLRRYSRQVLTAGKPDEPVADGGGPRANHSLFTAHLLDALEGKAAGPDGVLTGSNVTAYVYERVAKDHMSAQSPHYGHIDGDGDFIFNLPELSDPAGTTGNEARPEDVLIQVPPVVGDGSEDGAFLQTVKEYLSDPKHRIALDDLLTSELKTFLHITREEAFSVNGLLSTDTVAQRLQEYERAVSRLFGLLVLLTRWGDSTHRASIPRALSRLTDNNELRGGSAGLLGLRWYPLVRVVYGIAMTAIAGGQYENLRAAFTASAGDHVGHDSRAVLNVTIDGLYDAVGLFKWLPEHERAFMPLSEYLFKSLQAPIEDLLFLGRSYEQVFDEAEILLALSYADLDPGGPSGSWHPPGRFIWKHHRRFGNSPLATFLEKARAMHQRWPPLLAGFFGGTPELFAAHDEAIRAWADDFRVR